MGLILQNGQIEGVFLHFSIVAKKVLYMALVEDIITFTRVSIEVTEGFLDVCDGNMHIWGKNAELVEIFFHPFKENENRPVTRTKSFNLAQFEPCWFSYQA